MAISIADSLHISINYMRERELDPDQSIMVSLVRALCHVVKPVTLTSVTSVAGFTGLALGAGMAPIREFGLFAAVGVIAAWLLSLTLLPAVMLLLKIEPRWKGAPARLSWLDQCVSGLSAHAYTHPRIYSSAVTD